MYLICIDTQCPHTRLITNWSEQFTHSQCKPQIQYDQFAITLKDGINRNNTNLINSLESQITAKFLEFEMDIIKGIQNNLRNLQDQFFDSIQDIFHQIHNYNPIDFTTLEDSIKNSDFLKFCVSVLENKINYPEHCYLDNSFNTLNREFEKLYFEIQNVFKYQEKIQIPSDQIFAIIAPQVIQEDTSVNIPLKGYKNMQETLYCDKQVDQVDQTIGDGNEVNSEELTQLKLHQPNNQIKPESIEVNRPKFSNKPKDSQGQKRQKKTKQIQIILLPIFQVLPKIQKFSTEYTTGSIEFQRKGVFSNSQGTVYFEGFLNKTLTYSLLLTYYTQVKKFENYLEFGIIDCGTFTPQTQSKGPPPGVYSINYQGQIKENGITMESTVRMRPGNLFTMKYEGSTSTLSFSFHKDQININLQNIKGEICFFALLEKCGIAFAI